MMRSPLSPSTRARERRRVLRRLDEMFSPLVIARDDDRCQVCERKVRLQCCHVFTRSILATRWSLDNAFAGCVRCHRIWHKVGLMPRFAAGVPLVACHTVEALTERTRRNLIETGVALPNLDWWEERLGPARFAALASRARTTGKKFDPVAEELYLRQEARKLGVAMPLRRAG